MLGQEVRDVSGVVEAGVSAAVDGGVDELLDALLEGLVDHGFALGFFALDGLAFAHGDLDGEDAPDVRVDGFGGGEETWDVVHVAFDYFDVGSFGCELLGGGGFRVARDCKDCVVGRVRWG